MKKNIIPANLLTVLGLFLTGMLCFISCKKSEDVKAKAGKPEVELFDAAKDSTGNRVARLNVVHLSQDTVYLLNSNFVRQPGEQLIIDAGTLIKVSSPATNTGPSLIIQPGGFITATGTSEKPIVFTANARAGTQGPNWGGIIIQGKSFNNANGPTGVADDFSGVLRYVRVEFAFVALIGVGNKTEINNVMVSYTNQVVYAQYQSAYNIIGGTFNARNLISYANAGPADFFITNGYSGNMQNLIASRHPFFGHNGSGPDNSLAGIFIQNNSANSPAPTPYTNPIISNLTVVGPNGINGSPTAYMDTNLLAASLVTTNSACFHIRNSILLGFPAACWILNESATALNLRAGNGELDFSTVQSNNLSRSFYLAPGTFDLFNSEDFRNYMLSAPFHNQLFEHTDQFQLENITSYDQGPDLMPASGSPVLTGASYDSSVFYNNDYFDKTENFMGAIGKADWLKGWTNFIPLKTNYNFPQ